MNKKKDDRLILVVDDEEAVRASVSGMLRRAGYQVECVEGGAAAFSFLMRQTPDLILLDIMMPGMDGFEVLEQLAACGHTMPVVMFSAADDGQKSMVERAFGLGVVDYVHKTKDGLRELVMRVGLRIGQPTVAQVDAAWMEALDAGAHWITAPLGRARDTASSLSGGDRVCSEIDLVSRYYRDGMLHAKLKKWPMGQQPVSLADLLKDMQTRMAGERSFILSDPRYLRPGIFIAGNRRFMADALDKILRGTEEYAAPNATITLDIAENEMLVHLSFSFQGKIDASVLGQLLDARPHAKEGGRNCGLELAISALVAQKHGGELDCRSENGKTSFVLSLPKQ